MSNKDFLLCLLLSAFVFFAIKFFWKWVNGGFNNGAVREWMNRGFSFGLGFCAAMVVVILVIKLISGD